MLDEITKKNLWEDFLGTGMIKRAAKNAKCEAKTAAKLLKEIAAKKGFASLDDALKAAYTAKASSSPMPLPTLTTLALGKKDSNSDSFPTPSAPSPLPLENAKNVIENVFDNPADTSSYFPGETTKAVDAMTDYLKPGTRLSELAARLVKLEKENELLRNQKGDGAGFMDNNWLSGLTKTMQEAEKIRLQSDMARSVLLPAPEHKTSEFSSNRLETKLDKAVEKLYEFQIEQLKQAQQKPAGTPNEMVEQTAKTMLALEELKKLLASSGMKDSSLLEKLVDSALRSGMPVLQDYLKMVQQKRQEQPAQIFSPVGQTSPQQPAVETPQATPYPFATEHQEQIEQEARQAEEQKIESEKAKRLKAWDAHEFSAFPGEVFVD